MIIEVFLNYIASKVINRALMIHSVQDTNDENISIYKPLYK